MSNILTKLFKQSTIYSVGSASLQLANFLLVPLYARYLTPEEFGIQALFVILITILLFSIDLGIQSSINRIYYDYDSDDERKKLIGNAFIFTNIFGVAVTLIFLFLARPITQLLIDDMSRIGIYYFVIWDIFFLTTFRLYLAFLRLKSQAVRFVVFSVAKLLSVLGLVIFFVAFRSEGLLGVFKGNFFSSLIMYLLILPFVLRSIKISINIKMMREMIQFGLPFIPANIFAFILTSSDRYIIKAYASLQEVGLYAMGYRIGLVIYVFVVQPFVLAWPQQIVPISQKDNAAEIFRRISTYFLAVAGYCATVLIVFLDELYALFLTPEFYASKAIVPFIACSYIFYGFYYIFLVGIFLEKRTKYPPLIVGAAAILNVSLNIAYFIPHLGMMGAAYTTLAAYSVIPVTTYLISNRFYRLEIEYGRIAKLVVLFAVIIFAARFMPPVISFQVIACKVLLVLIGPAVLLAVMKFCDHREKQELHKYLSLLKKSVPFAL